MQENLTEYGKELRIKRYLSTKPIKAHKKVLAMWDSIRPLSLDLLSRYWR